MRVLVTGGAGFIGGRIVDALVGRGDEVVVLDDLSSGSRERLPAGVRLVEADIADPSTADLVAAARPALVVHAAAQVSVARSVADPELDAAVNVRGTEHVLAGAALAGTERFVFLSSGGAIYGEADGATEDAPPLPQSPYGRNKLSAERAVADGAASWGIARLSNVYGPGQRSDLEGGVVAIFTEAVLGGRPITIFGDGRQVRDFLHVDDAAAAIVAIADHAAYGTWNVSTGVGTSILNLVDIFETAVGRKLEARSAPAREGEVIRSRLDPARIARDLGWRPTRGLEEGVASLLRSQLAATG